HGIELLGGAGCFAGPAQPGQYLRRIQQGSRPPHAHVRGSEPVVGARRAVAEPRADGLAGVPGFASWQGVGRGHRTGYPRPRGPERTAGGGPVGSRRRLPEPGAGPGRGALYRIRASVTAVGVARILRFASVLPGQRTPGRTRRGTGGLAPALTGRRRKTS